MTHIRPYKHTDFPLLAAWWKHVGVTISEALIPVDTTFVAVINNTPAVAVSLYPTNCLAFCYIDGFVGNPALKGPQRQEVARHLVQYTEEYAKRRGFARLIALSSIPILTSRYTTWGYAPVDKPVSVLVKEL